MVYALARAVCLSLVSDHKTLSEMNTALEQQISISMQMNMMEGLTIQDNTPNGSKRWVSNTPTAAICSRLRRTSPMATTNFDIVNRALVLLGVRKTINSFTQDSLEAPDREPHLYPDGELVLRPRELELRATDRGTHHRQRSDALVPTAWSSTYASPPWLYQYPLPADYIRAIYITSNAAAAAGAGYAGGTTAVRGGRRHHWRRGPRRQLRQPGTWIYTAYVTSPTNWPFYFERLAVLAIAQNMCMTLTGNAELLNWLSTSLEQQIDIAFQLNKLEGLIIREDDTPEWIQAVGINYPFRRIDRTDRDNAPQPASTQIGKRGRQ